MRIISLIAVFTLATGVWADVTPSSSGVAEATSLQTLILRGDVHAYEDDYSRQLRIDRYRPRTRRSVGGAGTSYTDGGIQAPVRRERRNPRASITENGGGTEFMPSRPLLQRQNGFVFRGRNNALNVFGSNPTRE
jgi:hypothetical protein